MWPLNSSKPELLRGDITPRPPTYLALRKQLRAEKKQKELGSGPHNHGTDQNSRPNVQSLQVSQ